VKGPTGRGLTRRQIIATFRRRLKNQPQDELLEVPAPGHRIAEIRLNALLGIELAFGPAIMDWAEQLGAISDDEDGLTCAYMTPRTSARRAAGRMDDRGRHGRPYRRRRQRGGTLRRRCAGAKTLLTGSHYDTVRNGGKYDGRLGILLPLAIVKHLHARGERLPFDLEVIGFAEEEGVRFKSTFLGSSALAGRFDLDQLDQLDADGVTHARGAAGGRPRPGAIPAIARDPAGLLGYVEVHIEQGPVLLERDCRWAW
jgi:N-carbamoyl-L-amino-acid hydrolase